MASRIYNALSVHMSRLFMGDGRDALRYGTFFQEIVGSDAGPLPPLQVKLGRRATVSSNFSG
jgi:hypothetical protein